jgi:4-amino-4-deoxy-L-arabinose transferase-like glycosyltransferase
MGFELAARSIMTERDRRPEWAFFALAVFILLLGIGLRFANLMNMPLYVDEALHIWRAQRIAIGKTFAGVDQNKWLYSAVVGVFNTTGPESGFIARAISVLFSALTLASCIGLGTLLGGRRIGLLAGLFYMALPMALFHERQALVDSQLSAFTTLIILLSARLARRPQVVSALLLAVALTSAYLTKTAGLPFFLIPFFAVALLARRAADGLKTIGITLGGIGVSLGVRAYVYALAARQYVTPRGSHTATFENTIFDDLADPERLALLRIDLGKMLQIWLAYAGPVVLILVLLGALWIIRRRRSRELLFLLVPAVGFWFVPLMADRPTYNLLPPRYFMTSAAPLAVLAALSLGVTLAALSALLARRGREAQSSAWTGRVGALLIALAVVPGMWFGFKLATKPYEAALYFEDRRMYFLNSSSGFGHDILAEDLIARWRETGTRINVVANTFVHQQVSAYLGPRIGEGFRYRSADPQLHKAIAWWLAHGEEVYFVEASYYFGNSLPDYPYSTLTEPAGHYEAYNTALDLYRVTGMIGPQVAEIYTNTVPDADKLADQYQALSAALAGSPERVVIVHPASHAGMLSARLPNRIEPLALAIWPPTPEVVTAYLDSLNLAPDGAPLDVIVVDGAASDPERTIEQALLRSFYRTGDEWYGLLHRLMAVTGPADPAFEPVDTRFEGTITLARAAVVDDQIEPGGALRLALEWLTEQPVEDSYSIYIHLVDSEGTLYAQYDSVPGGGLLPMTTWEPDQTLVDRVALTLPDDLPAGAYSIRVGVYDPASGLRLPVMVGEDAGPDYALAGMVEAR